jgi:hypothetical protein
MQEIMVSRPNSFTGGVLITVAKRPTPGETKTRLSPPLSAAQAAALYECFILDAVELMRQVPDVRRVLAYYPPSERDYFYDLAPDFELAAQAGADLGARLDNLTKTYLERGYEKVVVVDSDSPNLPAEYIKLAFEGFSTGVDLMLGPCDDGGYYLIGLRRPASRLLREVQMSTPRVTADTLALAAEEGLRVHLLPAWYDIDDKAGLSRLIDDLALQPPEIAPHTRRLLAAEHLIGNRSYE